MQVAFPVSLLAAAAPFMAKQDVRYYLNGLLLEVDSTAIRIVATDGHALVVVRKAAANTDCGQVIIPRPLVEQVVKSKADEVTFDITDGVQIKALCGQAAFVGTAVDGRFPDWQAVMSQIESKTDGAPVMLQPNLLDKVIKAAKPFRESLLELRGQPTERSPMQFRLSNLPAGIAVAGVVMPAKLVKDQLPAERV